MRIFSKGNLLPIGRDSLGNEAVLDHLRFAGVAAVALLAPTLLFCVVVGHLWPLYLVAGSEVIGATIGIVNFKTPMESFPSFLQAAKVATIPKRVSAARLRKAA